MSLLFLSFVLVSVTRTMGQTLNATTDAVCNPGFEWATNSKQLSPCLVAAQVDAICNGGNWHIQALPNTSIQYTDPTGPFATLCTCSWANYNLLGACSACQGVALHNWPLFKANCAPSELSTTFFPESTIPLLPEVAIPFWAQQDPTSWTSQQFNPGQAQSFAQQGKPDFIGGGDITPSHKKTNVGAIVGGVIGGLVVVAAAVAVALWMLRRHRKSIKASGSYEAHPGHMRSQSDLSTASNMKSVNGGYSSLSAHMMSTVPTSPTVLTHNSSVRSAPYLSSVVASTAPYGTSSPPPMIPARLGASIPNPGPDTIIPYTLPPTVDNPDRKQSNGPIQVYDSPSAPPPVRFDSPQQTPSRRLNPPAYEYAESSPGSSSGRQPHRKQPSTDTVHSLASSRNAGGHSNNPSGSGMGNIAELTDLPPPPHEDHQSGHGRQVSTSTRDEKPPIRESYSASDLA